MKNLLLIPFLFLLLGFDAPHKDERTSQVKVIFLDVNETILDLNNMKASVADALGGRTDLLDIWFSKMLHYSLVATDINRYEHFGKIGTATLLMVAENNEIPLTMEEAKKAIVTPLRSLSPHPDVKKGLEILKKKGYKVITFTNSSYEGVKMQMQNAQLNSFIDQMLSVETIKTYKPHLDSYNWALKETGYKAEEVLMVAAHGWDVAGAKEAGLNTAFIKRKGKALYPLVEKPDFVVNDLIELANQMVDLSK
ncbi:haloacid dehalogenase type II [Flammeovirga sp. OC4]|uniref:haloacid dehalogenase type II n=1 Tax=Flammeovirga sp. OC4 TaxID=1382345 RepID=UPI0007C6D166|nr:haloacid dehalogenase type II [Flammeovirga sp. OC4]